MERNCYKSLMKQRELYQNKCRKIIPQKGWGSLFMKFLIFWIIFITGTSLFKRLWDKSKWSQKSDLKKEGVQLNRNKHKVVNVSRNKQVLKLSVEKLAREQFRRSSSSDLTPYIHQHKGLMRSCCKIRFSTQSGQAYPTWWTHPSLGCVQFWEAPSEMWIHLREEIEGRSLTARPMRK